MNILCVMCKNKATIEVNECEGLEKKGHFNYYCEDHYYNSNELPYPHFIKDMEDV